MSQQPPTQMNLNEFKKLSKKIFWCWSRPQEQKESRDHGEFDLNAPEEEVRPVPNGDFELVQLEEDPVRLVKVGVKIPLEVRAMLIEYFHDNDDLFRRNLT